MRDVDDQTSSPAMRELLETARRVAASDSTLLLLGETGSGKEWLARRIHQQGARAGGPFIAVNCAAVPETLLESELFGHERGAFSGAVRAHRGHFENAQGGTLFLDEISEMSPHLQAKLLRALQDRTVQRVGAERPIEIDVRLIAATNRDLAEALASNQLRKDLYYRLATVTLTMPPLRRRREDVPRLAGQYFEHFRARFGRPDLELDPAVLEALAAYAWPGNVRELINVVERAALLATGDRVRIADLPLEIAAAEATQPAGLTAIAGGDPAAAWLERPLRQVREETVAAVERTYLEGQLRRARGRIDDTARRAGITPRALYEKMKRYRLRKEDFR